MIHDSAGNLYGTTYRGGTANMGLVYMLDPSGHQTVLHHFAGGPDGAHPRGGVSATPPATFMGLLETAARGTGASYTRSMPPATRLSYTALQGARMAAVHLRA